MGVKEVMAGEGAAGTSATVCEGEAWLGAVTEVELVAGRRTGDGTESGRGAGIDAGAELESGPGVTAGAAAGF